MNLVEKLRDSGAKIYVVATGAGAGLQKIIWDVPGISKSLVGCEFPYAREATDQFLGFTPDKYVSKETAVDLASKAYIKAKKVAGWDGVAVGLGITAAVQSQKARRGKDEYFVAVVGDRGCFLEHFDISGPGMVRKSQGAYIDGAGLLVLLAGLGETQYQKSYIQDCSDLVLERVLVRPVFTKTERVRDHRSLADTLFPGTFNPLHDGHLAAVEHSLDVGDTCGWAINVDPVHKKALTGVDLLARVADIQSKSNDPIIFTQGQPLFLDKIQKNPHRSWIVGTDTLERMLDPKWGVDPTDLLEAIYTKAGQIHVIGQHAVGERARDYIHRLVPEKYRGPFKECNLDKKYPRSSDIRKAAGLI